MATENSRAITRQIKVYCKYYGSYMYYPISISRILTFLCKKHLLDITCWKSDIQKRYKLYASVCCYLKCLQHVYCSPTKFNMGFNSHILKWPEYFSRHFPIIVDFSINVWIQRQWTIVNNLINRNKFRVYLSRFWVICCA